MSEDLFKEIHLLYHCGSHPLGPLRLMSFILTGLQGRRHKSLEINLNVNPVESCNEQKL